MTAECAGNFVVAIAGDSIDDDIRCMSPRWCWSPFAPRVIFTRKLPTVFSAPSVSEMRENADWDSSRAWSLSFWRLRRRTFGNGNTSSSERYLIGASSMRRDAIATFSSPSMSPSSAVNVGRCSWLMLANAGGSWTCTFLLSFRLNWTGKSTRKRNECQLPMCVLPNHERNGLPLFRSSGMYDGRFDRNDPAWLLLCCTMQMQIVTANERANGWIISIWFQNCTCAQAHACVQCHLNISPIASKTNERNFLPFKQLQDERKWNENEWKKQQFHNQTCDVNTYYAFAVLGIFRVCAERAVLVRSIVCNLQPMHTWAMPMSNEHCGNVRDVWSLAGYSCVGGANANK